ncbi:MAG: ABC transporter ATP-binding protein [Thermacetogeniaceae bacterium]
MLLEAVNISKKYDNEVVLKEVSLGIEQGSSLVITGPSGSGKSTLLSILGLLLQPTEGEVLYNGRKVSDLSDDERSRLRNRSFGFIFQSPQLIGSLSVLDNVLVPARLARKRSLEAKAETILKDLGLKNRLDYLPYQLSIGQKRRVAVARALLLDPIVIFADEPTNDLDPERAAWIGEFLFELPRKERALVLVTHDTRLASKADRAVQIIDNRVRDLPIGELKTG